MFTGFLVPALAFGTLLAVLWFGVLGVSAVKKNKREQDETALASRDDETDGSTRMMVPSAADDPNSGARPIGIDQNRPPRPNDDERPASVHRASRDATRPADDLDPEAAAIASAPRV